MVKLLGKKEYKSVKTKKEKILLISSLKDSGADTSTSISSSSSAVVSTKSTPSKSSSSGAAISPKISNDSTSSGATLRKRKHVKKYDDDETKPKIFIHSYDELVYDDSIVFDAVDEEDINTVLENIPEATKNIYPLEKVMGEKSGAIIINYQEIKMQKEIAAVVKKYNFQSFDDYLSISKQFEGKAFMASKGETTESIYNQMCAISDRNEDQECIMIFTGLLSAQNEIKIMQKTCEDELHSHTDRTIFFANI